MDVGTYQHNGGPRRKSAAPDPDSRATKGPTSPLFSAAERAALDLAVAGASVPNAATDEMFVALRKHWSDEQIVEIVGVIAMFGFLNRWNDTLATALEDEPIAVGEKYLAPHGWSPGKHGA